MNPIGWCTDTINPITGCRNGCDYCYARKFAARHAGRFGYPKKDPFQPTFHPDKLEQIYNLGGAHKRVFLDSMGDWFSDGVIVGWFDPIINAIRCQPDHTFLVLTKRPDQMMAMRDLDLPSNLWFGVSVTCQEDAWRIDELVHNSPIPQDQHVFVSFEPLHGPVDAYLGGIDWVIIGGENGNRKEKIWLKRQWLDHICHQANVLDIPVYLKPAGMCGPKPDGSYDPRTEFPEAMR